MEAEGGGDQREEEQSQTSKGGGGKHRGRKAKKEEEAVQSWSIKPFTDREEFLHFSVIKLDEHKVFGQVNLLCPMAVACFVQMVAVYCSYKLSVTMQLVLHLFMYPSNIQ